jgi:hypothetical protein
MKSKRYKISKSKIKCKKSQKRKLWGVTDVSALSTVHTLTLRDMPGVTDVSALSTVNTLTLVE